MRSGSKGRETGSGWIALKVALGVPFVLRPEEATVHAEGKLVVISPPR